MENKAITISDVMLGFALLGESTHTEGFAPFLSGQYDREISIAIYHREYGKLPTEEDLSDALVVENLNKLKNALRTIINRAVSNLERLGAERSLREAKVAFNNAANNFKAMSKPAPEGTVDELAKKYNVSKSHIRMLKRENRLHELSA